MLLCASLVSFFSFPSLFIVTVPPQLSPPPSPLPSSSSLLTFSPSLFPIIPLVFSVPSFSYVTSSPAIDGSGNIYIASYDYKVYSYTGTGTLRWTYPTGAAIWSSPILGSDNTVYIGSTGV